MKISYALLTLAFTFLLFASLSPKAVSHALQAKPSAKPQTKPAATPQGKPAPAAAPVVPCDLDAYVVEEDEKGLNVRSGPGKDHKVIAVLTGDEDDEQTVHITGISSGWMRISTAQSLEGKSLFKGTGWVFASKLGTSVRPDGKGGYEARLYQEPNVKSAVVGKVAAEDGTVIVGCKGAWVQVKSEKIVGWLSPEGQCPNPVTTCP
jgi:SH3-like domain-containing protein